MKYLVLILTFGLIGTSGCSQQEGKSAALKGAEVDRPAAIARLREIQAAIPVLKAQIKAYESCNEEEGTTCSAGK